MKMFNKYYLQLLKSYRRKNSPLLCRVQLILQFFGIAVHNPFRDECCIDFECCNPYYDKRDRCWLHISRKKLPVKRIIWYEPTAPVGTPDRTFIKKTKLSIFNNNDTRNKD